MSTKTSLLIINTEHLKVVLNFNAHSVVTFGSVWTSVFNTNNIAPRRGCRVVFASPILFKVNEKY